MEVGEEEEGATEVVVARSAGLRLRGGESHFPFLSFLARWGCLIDLCAFEPSLSNASCKLVPFHRPLSKRGN